MRTTFIREAEKLSEVLEELEDFIRESDDENRELNIACSHIELALSIVEDFNQEKEGD